MPIPPFGSAPDSKKVKVSSNDTTPAFLLAKLAAGTGISLAETNDGGNETVTITNNAGGVAGTLNVNTTAVGNVGVGEDTLISYTVTGGTLSTNGDYLTFDATGTIANSVNAKRIKVIFGTTTLFDTGAAGIPISSAFDWTCRGEIIRTAATTFKANVYFNTSNATLASYAEYVSGTETLANALALKMTGEATTDNDVVQQSMVTRVNSTTTDALSAYAPKASPTFTGTVSIPTPFNLGGVSVLPTGTELNYVDGVTSAIQTQIDGKQPLDSDLTTIAGLTATTDNFMVATASAWASRTPTQARSQMGLGALAVLATVGTSQIDNDAVTFAKMQNIATNSLIGRDTASTGDPENILLDDTLEMDGSGNLQRAALTGDVTSSAGSNATTIAWTRNPYCFRAYASVTTTLSDNSNVKIAFATEEYDYNNNFASSTYTAPVAGVYHFSACYLLAGIATGVLANCKIYKNGALAFLGHGDGMASNGSYTASGDILLAANDTIEVYGFQNSAGDENIVIGSDSTWFSGHLVHRTA